ncbi:hypothetical protein F3Y22_tig00008706pilonHSYRG00074 [Hibiscus syriacus]|uniref:Heterodimeric geranylgeranyl pyrophosphate synthase small subunit n=1 Tax=Hibiscus syriacus TaxID=106335 RepID=A0A6A3C9R6_HIBSY|nr:heterodimeric geranylgeranyl pyrophosphate synthase small subunit, chloroplastic-like [Hibiscus syriacus]KAE8725486.1 hypothetical protein F3Y22_tig00008706pilonHSYRG00074 [Hibiscus syriacus]
MSMARALSHINGNSVFHVPCRPKPKRQCPLQLPRRVFKVTVSCNQSYWDSINSDIKAHLNRAIPIREPLTVFEPMNGLTFAAPRSIVPALCVAACELLGGHRDDALPTASALWLMYSASFTHEHLPLTQSCRPKSDVRHLYGPNIELLIGDAMIPFGLELLAKSDDRTQNISTRILRVMIEITRAIGSQGMIYKQYHDVERHRSNNNKSYHVEKLEKYEGTLHACAAACGAILGGGSEEEIEKMRRYGLYVGKIQGMVSRAERNDKELNKSVEEMRRLATKELSGFNEAKVQAISTYFESDFMYAQF